MKRLILLISAAWFCQTTLAEKCETSPQVIANASKSELRDFWTWMAKNKTEETENVVKYSDGVSVYIVDIDNSGNSKFVVTDFQGSGAYLSLLVFEKTKDGFRQLKDAPPRPAVFAGMDGPWFAHNFFNPATKTPELFLSACGTTYMEFYGDETGTSEAFLWKDGKTSPACDEAWTRHQFDQFQSMYDRKMYDQAANNFRSYYKRCSQSMSAENRLRLLSDLTVTDVHLNDSSDCLAYVKEAKSLSIFSTSMSKKSILHNEELCTALQSKTTVRFKSAEEIKNSGLTDEILSATVPKMEFAQNSFDTRAEKWQEAGIVSDNARSGTHRKFELRDEVRLALSGPGPESEIFDTRTVMLSGCRAHSCGDQGMVWVDTKKNVSVFALNTFPFSEADRSCVTIGSRTLKADQLPETFWKAFKKWSKTAGQPACAFFVDGGKKDVEIHSIRLKL